MDEENYAFGLGCGKKEQVFKMFGMLCIAVVSEELSSWSKNAQDRKIVVHKTFLKGASGPTHMQVFLRSFLSKITGLQ